PTASTFLNASLFSALNFLYRDGFGKDFISFDSKLLFIFGSNCHIGIPADFTISIFIENTEPQSSFTIRHVLITMQMISLYARETNGAR
ncbi:MAG: hypothetical protein ACI9SQ_001650, partial [Rubritalea sp.]